MINRIFGLAVRVIITDDEGKILIIKRSSHSKTNPGRWELPGGKVDQGESFDQALLREVYEETGLKISLDHVVGVSEQNLHIIRAVHIIMAGTVTGGELNLSSEHDGYAWVYIDNLSQYELADWMELFVHNYYKQETNDDQPKENILKPWIGSMKNSIDKILKNR
ncbi:MAG: NUDIX domain-containing protein [Methanobacteriaceae archaeon]|nr:MAG: NUDIX hydrolase [Methanobacterium sp. BRmetb2]MCC7558428.1 NUDIX domain-containing protein [Methanobacteriaceae archaeon]